MPARNYILDDKEPYKLLIPGYPEGSNITILNTAYTGRHKNEQTGDTDPDFIAILFRDNETGCKKVHVIYEPLYTFYLLKDGYQIPDYTMFFIEKDKVKPITCKAADLLRAIAQVTDNMDFYRKNVEEGNSSENRKLHTCPEIFMSDMNVENYYRFLFSQSYTNDVFKLSKDIWILKPILDIVAENSQRWGKFQ